MWKGNHYTQAPYYYSPYCYQCGGEHEDGACMMRRNQPQWYYQQEQYAYPPQCEESSPSSSSEKDELKSIILDMTQSLEKQFEQIREDIHVPMNSFDRQEPQREIMPCEIEVPQVAKPHQQEENAQDTSELADMIQNLGMKLQAQFQQVTDKIISNVHGFQTQSDELATQMDQQVAQEEITPIQFEEPQLVPPPPQEEEKDDIDRDLLWCEDDDDGDVEEVSIDMDEIEVRAPIPNVQEFSKACDDQGCDELERLLYGDSIGDECQDHPSIPCSVDSLIYLHDIDKEVEITKCGGMDDVHTWNEERQQMETHELPFQVPKQASKEEETWRDFSEIFPYKPRGTSWKMIKKIKCKMKGIVFNYSPPIVEHVGTREKRVKERRWWKKKKWRYKEA